MGIGGRTTYNALSTLAPKEPPELKNRRKAYAINKHGEEPMHQALLVQELKAHFRMSGVDLVAIDAIGVETVKVVISE